MSTTIKRPAAPGVVQEILDRFKMLIAYLKAPEHMMIGLTSGTSEPDTKTGIEQIWSDGTNVKIKFSNGTVKTFTLT